MNLIDVFARAGLSDRDVARLLGISHVTVFYWTKRRRSPCRMIQDKLTALVSMSEKLLAEGKLPVKCPRNERNSRLRKLFSAT